MSRCYPVILTVKSQNTSDFFDKSLIETLVIRKQQLNDNCWLLEIKTLKLIDDLIALLLHNNIEFSAIKIQVRDGARFYSSVLIGDELKTAKSIVNPGLQ